MLRIFSSALTTKTALEVACEACMDVLADGRDDNCGEESVGEAAMTMIMSKGTLYSRTNQGTRLCEMP